MIAKTRESSEITPPETDEYAKSIIVLCPQTHRTQTMPTDDWVAAVKSAPFPDACVFVKDPKCVLFMDQNGYPTRVLINEDETLVMALKAIVRWQNTWRALERKKGGKANG